MRDPDEKSQVRASGWELPSISHLFKHGILEPGGTLPQLQKTYFRPEVSE